MKAATARTRPNFTSAFDMIPPLRSPRSALCHAALPQSEPRRLKGNRPRRNGSWRTCPECFSLTASARSTRRYRRPTPEPRSEKALGQSMKTIPASRSMRRHIRAFRLARLRAQLVRADVAGILLILDPVNLRYATGSRNMQVWTMHNLCRYVFVATSGPVVLFDLPSSMHLSTHLETIDERRPSLAWDYMASGRAGRGDGRALGRGDRRSRPPSWRRQSSPRHRPRRSAAARGAGARRGRRPSTASRHHGADPRRQIARRRSAPSSSRCARRRPPSASWRRRWSRA